MGRTEHEENSLFRGLVSIFPFSRRNQRQGRNLIFSYDNSQMSIITKVIKA